MSKFTVNGKLNPLDTGREGAKVITRGVMNRLLQWAQTRTEEGFTENEAAYYTGVFNAAQVVQLLEKERHRFTRVNEPSDGNQTVTRFYLEAKHAK